MKPYVKTPSMIRRIAVILLVSVCLGAAMSAPAYALRAAGLEENAALEEAADQLGVPSQVLRARHAVGLEKRGIGHRLTTLALGVAAVLGAEMAPGPLAAQAPPAAPLVAESPAPPWLGIQKSPIGTHVTIDGPSAATAYHVYATTNVVQGPWDRVAENLPAAASGPTRWIDYVETPARFYRAEVSTIPGPHRQYTRTRDAQGNVRVETSQFDTQGRLTDWWITVTDPSGQTTTRTILTSRVLQNPISLVPPPGDGGLSKRAIPALIVEASRDQGELFVPQTPGTHSASGHYRFYPFSDYRGDPRFLLEIVPSATAVASYYVVNAARTEFIYIGSRDDRMSHRALDLEADYWSVAAKFLEDPRALSQPEYTMLLSPRVQSVIDQQFIATLVVQALARLSTAFSEHPTFQFARDVNPFAIIKKLPLTRIDIRVRVDQLSKIWNRLPFEGQSVYLAYGVPGPTAAEVDSYGELMGQFVEGVAAEEFPLLLPAIQDLVRRLDLSEELRNRLISLTLIQLKTNPVYLDGTGAWSALRFLYEVFLKGAASERAERRAEIADLVNRVIANNPWIVENVTELSLVLQFAEAGIVERHAEAVKTALSNFLTAFRDRSSTEAFMASHGGQLFALIPTLKSSVHFSRDYSELFPILEAWNPKQPGETDIQYQSRLSTLRALWQAGVFVDDLGGAGYKARNTLATVADMIKNRPGWLHTVRLAAASPKGGLGSVRLDWRDNPLGFAATFLHEGGHGVDHSVLAGATERIADHWFSHSVDEMDYVTPHAASNREEYFGEFAQAWYENSKRWLSTGLTRYRAGRPAMLNMFLAIWNISKPVDTPPGDVLPLFMLQDAGLLAREWIPGGWTRGDMKDGTFTFTFDGRAYAVTYHNYTISDVTSIPAGLEERVTVLTADGRNPFPAPAKGEALTVIDPLTIFYTEDKLGGHLLGMMQVEAPELLQTTPRAVDFARFSPDVVARPGNVVVYPEGQAPSTADALRRQRVVLIPVTVETTWAQFLQAFLTQRLGVQQPAGQILRAEFRDGVLGLWTQA